MFWPVSGYSSIVIEGRKESSRRISQRVLSFSLVMGPSGAGKTTLISALTLAAFYGKLYGSVTLNGVPLTDKIFKSHCYVVVQQDKHWPYLTCRETLLYAAEFYDIASQDHIPVLVDQIIGKMGLDICKDTRNARLSGGQARRLSIAMALLKQPTVLFLDEPTSGLDSGTYCIDC